jgi:phytoene/squalene synthetase
MRYGRILFPVDELLQAGVDNADLAAVQAPPQLEAVLLRLRAQAERGFADAAAALPPAERARQRHLLVLSALGRRRLNDNGPGESRRLRDMLLAWKSARGAALGKSDAT